MELYLMNLSTGEGNWISLPTKNEFISSFIMENRISTRLYEEYIIADTNFEDELFLEIGELESPYEVNELISEYESLDSHEQKVVLALLEKEGNSLKNFRDALSRREDEAFYLECSIRDEYDLGYFMIQESGQLGQVPYWLRPYIDYEAYGRDTILEGSATLTKFGALL